MVGTKERVTFDDTTPAAPVSVVPTGVRAPRDDERAPYVVEDQHETAVAVASSEPLKNQTIDFLDSVERGRAPVSTGETGLRVVEVMEAIDASIAAGGAPIPVQRLNHNKDDNP
jgi:predicted dehydrogenase